MNDLNDTVPLAAIDCAIALRDVYDKVQFTGNDETPSLLQDIEPTR
jgi:hypothetical protein